MFYDIFKGLCDSKGVSPSRACLEMNLSRSLGAKWKNTGANPSFDVLSKMASYFGVSVDYLLGNEQKEKPAQVRAENSELDQAFFRVMKSAQDKGYSAHDIELALDFIKRARERDQK